MLCGVISVDGSETTEDTDEVITLASDQVVTISNDEVVIEAQTVAPVTEIFKYLLYWPNGSIQRLTYGEMRDTGFRDFRSFDNTGISYVSTFTSGYRIRGETLRKFNATPISVTVENYALGVNPRLTMRGIWDYGFRTTSTQELYITRPEPDYLVRRIKLRGKGKALQLQFNSVGDAPFTLIGWATFDSGGQSVS